MNYNLFGLAAMAVAAGCGIQAASAEDEYARVDSIAVISELPQELLVQFLGFTHFDYGAYKVPVGSTLSDHAVSTVKAALKHRFTILSDSPSPELFAQNIFGLFTRQQLARIAALPASERADAYIVIYPVECQLNMGSMTLIHQKGAPAGYGTTLCTGTRIAVLDGRSGKSIDYGTSSSPAACADNILAPNGQALSEGQKEQLLASAENVIDKTLVVAMNSANLISDSEAQKLGGDARRISASLPCQWW